ncbi:hypothetical protein DdX_14270 [Ditylenchus destructor]|uniref:Uncharacterized protein n=1 Tax=Ditylenchus destructor TaxID=166010 RepID=A0AAD4MRD7_9BILA|nr:hypothetical protein DdX_14270 [Ditylenchus destructor]
MQLLMFNQQPLLSSLRWLEKVEIGMCPLYTAEQNPQPMRWRGQFFVAQSNHNSLFLDVVPFLPHLRLRWRETGKNFEAQTSPAAERPIHNVYRFFSRREPFLLPIIFAAHNELSHMDSPTPPTVPGRSPCSPPTAMEAEPMFRRALQKNSQIRNHKNEQAQRFIVSFARCSGLFVSDIKILKVAGKAGMHGGGRKRL